MEASTTAQVDSWRSSLHRQATAAREAAAKALLRPPVPSLQAIAAHFCIESIWGVQLALLAVPDQYRLLHLHDLLLIDLDWSNPPHHQNDEPPKGAPDPKETFLHTRYSAPKSPAVPAPEPIQDPATPFRFKDGSTVGPASEIIPNPRVLEYFRTGYLGLLHEKLATAWRRLGQDQRRRMKDHCAVTSDQVAETARGYHFDLSDYDRVKQRSIADAPVKSKRGPWVEDFLNRFNPGGAAAYPNQSILYELKYGVRFHKKFSYSGVMAPPYANALPHLDVLWAALSKDIGKGYYTASPTPVAFPSSMHAVGAVVKNGKCRPTTGCDGPHDAVDSEGIPLAVNEASLTTHATLEDIKWLTMAHSFNQSGILSALFQLLKGQLTPERLEKLRPTAAVVDVVAFFRRIGTCTRDLHLQSLIFPAPQGPLVLTSESMIFGMDQAPFKAQSIAFLSDDVHAICTGKWWTQVRRTAEGRIPAPRELRLAAEDVAPPELTAWLDLREAQLGVGQANVLPSMQYIDDRKMGAMGNVAMLAGFLIMSHVSSKPCLDFALEPTKHQGGHAVDYLGNREYVGYNIVDLTYKRYDQLEEMSRRFQNLQFVERRELEAINGKLGFVAQVIDGIRPFLARSYKVIHQDQVWFDFKRTKSEAMKMRTWLANDHKDYMGLITEFRGRPFLQEPWSLQRDTILTAYSDSNRPGSAEKYGGMGAFVAFNGYIKFWHLRFPKEVVDLLPVHITERLAPEITIALMPELTHCRLLQRVDNMAAVCALQSRKAYDPRFQDLQIITERQTTRYHLEIATEWIATKCNLWADLISRGEIRQFMTLARQAGCENLIELDVARLNLPGDLAHMFQRMITMTSLLPKKIRSETMWKKTLERKID